MMKTDRGLLNKYRSCPIAAKAAFWFMVCSFIQKGILAFTTPLFARLMSTEQYGQFTIYTSWSNILLILSTLKLDDSVFNVGMAKYKNQRDVYVSTMQFITIVLSSILLLFFFFFHSQITFFIGLPREIILFMIIESYMNSAVYFWNRRNRYEYSYKPVLIRIVLMTILSTALGLILVLNMKEKGYGRILSCILINTIFGSGILIYNLKKGGFKFSWEYAKYAVLFNLPLLGHYLSIYVLDQFDRIMVQKIEGFSAAALYGLAYHIGTILTLFSTSLNNAMTPWMYEKLEKEDFEIIGKILFVIVLITSIVAVGVTALAPELILIFGGPKYQEAQLVIPPIAIGMVFQLLYLVFANIEFYYEKNKAAMFMSGFAAILDIILNYIGIKLYGYVAAAYTTMICYIVLFILHYLYTRIVLSSDRRNKFGLKIKNIVFLLIIETTVCIGLVFMFPYRILRCAMVIIGLCIVLIFRRATVSTLKMILSGRDKKHDEF